MKTATLFLLIATLLGGVGCTSAERLESLRDRNLRRLETAVPIGMDAKQVAVAAKRDGWSVSSFSSFTEWTFGGEKKDVDKIIDVGLSHAAIPFRIIVVGHIGLKEGKVVSHFVELSENAL